LNLNNIFGNPRHRANAKSSFGL
jgi:hypothetical protein